MSLTLTSFVQQVQALALLHLVVPPLALRIDLRSGLLLQLPVGGCLVAEQLLQEQLVASVDSAATLPTTLLLVAFLVSQQHKSQHLALAQREGGYSGALPPEVLDNPTTRPFRILEDLQTLGKMFQNARVQASRHFRRSLRRRVRVAPPIIFKVSVPWNLTKNTLMK